MAVRSQGAEIRCTGCSDAPHLPHRAGVLDGIRELSRADAQPSNRQVAPAFAGISDPVILKPLSRLQRLGLIETRGGGQDAQGAPNQWCLTEKGHSSPPRCAPTISADWRPA